MGGGGGFGFGGLRADRTSAVPGAPGYISAFARTPPSLEGLGGAKLGSSFGFGHPLPPPAGRAFHDPPLHSAPLPATSAGGAGSMRPAYGVNDFSMTSLPSIRVTALTPSASATASQQLLVPSSAMVDTSEVPLVSPAMSLRGSEGGPGGILSPAAGAGGGQGGGRRFGFGISRRASHITPKGGASADASGLAEARVGGNEGDEEGGADDIAIKVEAPEGDKECGLLLKAEEVDGTKVEGDIGGEGQPEDGEGDTSCAVDDIGVQIEMLETEISDLEKLTHSLQLHSHKVRLNAPYQTVSLCGNQCASLSLHFLKSASLP